jgi:hypothetical protein
LGSIDEANMRNFAANYGSGDRINRGKIQLMLTVTDIQIMANILRCCAAAAMVSN